MRLTNPMRGTIAKAILDHKYAALLTAADKKQALAGDAVYDALYAEHKQWMCAAPPGAMQEADQFNVVVCGKNGHKRYENVRLSTARPLLFADTCRWYPMAKAPPEVLSAYDAYAHAAEAFAAVEAERDATAQDINGVLYSVTTVKRLLEVWPEIATFVPDKPTSGGAMAVVPAALNKTLDLPPSTTENNSGT